VCTETVVCWLKKKHSFSAKYQCRTDQQYPIYVVTTKSMSRYARSSRMAPSCFFYCPEPIELPCKLQDRLSKTCPLQLFSLLWHDTWPQSRPVISFFLLHLGGNFINFLFFIESQQMIDRSMRRRDSIPTRLPSPGCSHLFTDSHSKISETQWRTQENQWGKIEGKVFCTTLKNEQ